MKTFSNPNYEFTQLTPEQKKEITDYYSEPANIVEFNIMLDTLYNGITIAGITFKASAIYEALAPDVYQAHLRDFESVKEWEVENAG